MARPTGSSADASAAIEKDNVLRAALSEAASRQTALDNAAADAIIAADRVAAEQLRLNPPVVPVAPKLPAWQPTDTLNADAVRMALAAFGRSILGAVELVATDPGYSLGIIGPILAEYEVGQLAALIGALERGAGSNAARVYRLDPPTDFDARDFAQKKAAALKVA